MNIIFAGTPDFATIALQKLLKNTQHKIVAVYTQPDRKSGRGLKLQASPVKLLAQQHNIPVLQPQSLRNDEIAQQQLFDCIQKNQVDLMVVAAYGLLLPLSVLQAFKFGCVNIHASLLPKWRGAAPIARCIENGDTETGISIMQMATGLDTGDVLLKKSLAIEKDDNAETLTIKLANLGGDLIIETLDNLENLQKNATPQNENLASYAHKLEKSEANINWKNSAISILRKIKAFNPFPATQTEFCIKDKNNKNNDNKKIVLKIWDADLLDDSDNFASENTKTTKIGELIINKEKKLLVVMCGDNKFLQLKIIQKPGSKKITAKEFILGLN